MSIRFDGAGLDLAMRSFRFFHKAALWAQQFADPRRAVSFFSEKGGEEASVSPLNLEPMNSKSIYALIESTACRKRDIVSSKCTRTIS